MYPKELVEFVEILNKLKIGLKVKNEVESKVGEYLHYGLEERTISTLMEPALLKIIADHQYEFKKFGIELKKPQTRPCWDCIVNGYPIDIKVTEGKNADNLSAPGQILYVLTGDLLFSEKSKDLDSSYLDRFKKASIDPASDKDFYYVVLNKKNWEFKLFSLKTLSELRLNNAGSNFLQVSWNKNSEKQIIRSTPEFISWILSIIKKYKGFRDE